MFTLPDVHNPNAPRSLFTGQPIPGYYIPDPMGFKRPGDVFGPFPMMSDYCLTPPDSHYNNSFLPSSSQNSYTTTFNPAPAALFASVGSNSFSSSSFPSSFGSSSLFAPQPQVTKNTNILNMITQLINPVHNNFYIDSSNNTGLIYDPCNTNPNTWTCVPGLPEPPQTDTGSDCSISATLLLALQAFCSGSGNDYPGGYNPNVFDPKPLNPVWGNNDIPYDLAATASGLYGNIHGLNAIMGRFIGDLMPSAIEDPTAPGNTWIYTTRDNPWI